MLRRAAAALKEFIAAEIVETAADHSGEKVAMAESNVDILKAGARYSKSTKAALAKVHGMLRDAEKAMTEMGYEDAEEGEEGEEKADQVDDVAKAEPIAAEVADLAKAAGVEVAEGALYSDLAKAALADLAKSRARVAELEAQPEPAKVATTAIEKGEDVKDSLANPGAAPDPSNPLSMFKAALSRPIVIGG